MAILNMHKQYVPHYFLFKSKNTQDVRFINETTLLEGFPHSDRARYREQHALFWQAYRIHHNTGLHLTKTFEQGSARVQTY